MDTPLQKIYYGPPGAGKSTKVRAVARERGIGDADIIESTFHTDFSYGDFVAKIIPTTVMRKDGDGRMSSVIRYQIHVGPFIKAVARALQSKGEVLLVIDEINRGNGSAIFGDIFQLLDRDDAGLSTYGITLSDLVFGALMKEFGWTECEDGDWIDAAKEPVCLSKPDGWDEQLGTLLRFLGSGATTRGKLRIPANLSILATMNTSDESVYVMDTAFKRRWGFEFICWDYARETDESKRQGDAELRRSDATKLANWHDFLVKLNAFIAEHAPGTRVEDKQVGLWFIKAELQSEHKVLHRALEGLKASTSAFEFLRPNRFRAEMTRRKSSIITPKELAIFIDMETKIDQFLNRCVPLGGGATTYAASDEWNDLHAALFTDPAMQLSEEQLGELNNRVSPLGTWVYPAGSATYDKNSFMASRGRFFAAIIDIYLAVPSNNVYLIPDDALQYKLLHFIWDNVFYRDKSRLSRFIKPDGEELRTFDQFLSKRDAFLEAIMSQP